MYRPPLCLISVYTHLYRGGDCLDRVRLGCALLFRALPRGADAAEPVQPPHTVAAAGVDARNCAAAAGTEQGAAALATAPRQSGPRTVFLPTHPAKATRPRHTGVVLVSMAPATTRRANSRPFLAWRLSTELPEGTELSKVSTLTTTRLRTLK